MELRSSSLKYVIGYLITPFYILLLLNFLFQAKFKHVGTGFSMAYILHNDGHPSRHLSAPDDTVRFFFFIALSWEWNTVPVPVP
jgi:hypothetical protein